MSTRAYYSDYNRKNRKRRAMMLRLWRIANRQAIKVSQTLGVPIDEARRLLNASRRIDRPQQETSA